MRCPKCGTISFDYLKRCGKCGKELGEVAKNLGNFYHTDREFDWFRTKISSNSAPNSNFPPSPPPVMDTVEEAPPVKLDDIDISDLVEEKELSGESPIELNIDDIETITLNDDLKNAIDDVMKDDDR